MTDNTQPSPGQRRLLEQISAAFRKVSSEPESPDALFQWRHLRVMEKIGEGGFGEVYRAYDPQLRRDVALKLNRPGSGDRLARDGVMAEARRMARLRHPNILAVHGADEADGQVGIWFDLLSGETLEALSEREALLPEQVQKLALPLASALELIHANGLVHGDVKPDNIMVLNDGAPVLMDFGAATEALIPQLQTAGSPLLMAPEQFAGQVATPASDMYALGATLYRVLTGTYPLQASSFEALAELHAGLPAIKMSSLPRQWRTLLADLLNRKPEHRPTAGQLEASLRHLAEAPQRRRRRAAVGVVMASLAAATVISLTAARNQARSQQRTEAVKNTLVEAIQTVAPLTSSSPGTIENLYQNLQQLARDRLQLFPQGQADVLLVTAQGLAGFGDTRQAIEGALEGVKLLEDDPDTSLHSLATAYSILATTYNAAEDYPASLATAQKTLALLQGQEFKSAPDLRLIAQNKIYFALDGLGRWREALAAQQDLLAARQAMFGKDSMRVAVDHHNLAATLMNFGEFEQAVSHSRRAVQILALNQEEQSARMGIALAALGRGLLNAGDTAGAFQIYQRAQALLTDAFGPGHWRVLGLKVLDAQIQLAQSQESQEGGQERDQALAQLAQLADMDAASGLDRFNALRILARQAAQQRQWSVATDHWQAALDAMPETMELLRPVLQSAHSHSAFKAGQTLDSAQGDIQSTLADMEQQGLAKAWGMGLLKTWLRETPGPNP